MATTIVVVRVGWRVRKSRKRVARVNGSKPPFVMSLTLTSAKGQT